jgi:hypothetical protein
MDIQQYFRGKEHNPQEWSLSDFLKTRRYSTGPLNEELDLVNETDSYDALTSLLVYGSINDLYDLADSGHPYIGIEIVMPSEGFEAANFSAKDPVNNVRFRFKTPRSNQWLYYEDLRTAEVDAHTVWKKYLTASYQVTVHLIKHCAMQVEAASEEEAQAMVTKLINDAQNARSMIETEDIHGFENDDYTIDVGRAERVKS